MRERRTIRALNGARCSRCGQTRREHVRELGAMLCPDNSGKTFREFQSPRRASMSLSEAEVTFIEALLRQSRIKGADCSVMHRRPEAASLAAKIQQATRSMQERQRQREEAKSTSNGGNGT